MTTKQYAKWKQKIKVARQYGQPRSFLPKGNFEFVLYVIVLAEHPTYVKVGKSMKWKQRREVYANWNFAKGNGIAREVKFTITEEFIDLTKLENEMLARMKFPRAHGYEWFIAEADKVVNIIEEMLREYGLSHEKEENSYLTEE